MGALPSGEALEIGHSRRIFHPAIRAGSNPATLERSCQVANPGRSGRSIWILIAMLSGFTTFSSCLWFRTALREMLEPEHLLDLPLVLIGTQGPIEIPSVKPRRRDVRHSFDCGPTGNLVQHGDLAEGVAGLHLPDNLSVHKHSGNTREYDEQALVFVALHRE